MSTIQCQVSMLDDIRVGSREVVPRPLKKRFLLAVSRSLDPRLKRQLRKLYRAALPHPRAGQATHRPPVDAAPAPTQARLSLRIGDVVRVRPMGEIEATLDQWGKLKGCRFMPEMRPYCGSTQRVLKPMERFFDECEYAVKKANGLVLLEGVMCQGVRDSGPCDRSCFFFWRQEWLEPA